MGIFSLFKRKQRSGDTKHDSDYLIPISGPGVTRDERLEQGFLACLSGKEKVAVSNLGGGIYVAVIMEKEGNATAAARLIDSYLKQNPRLTSSLKLLRRLSVAEVQRLGMSVSAGQEGIKSHSVRNLAEAKRHFEEACRHNPYNADAWCSLGVVVAEAGDHREGIMMIKKALALEPDNQAARDNLKAIGGNQ